MLEEITQYLQHTYNPDSIILHGSRAVNRERPHSDWDFILLYTELNNQEVPAREFYKNEHLELYVVTTPVKNIFDVFGTKLQNTQLVSDKDNLGLELLYEAQKIYRAGLHWSDEKIEGNRLWMRGRLDGMKDTIDKPELFAKYFSDMYVRLHNYWYILLHQEYSKPIYLAHDEIKERDEIFYNLLINLSSTQNSTREKLKTSENIFLHLFGE